MDWTPLHELTERFTLPNGLIGLVKEDHAAEIVSAQVWVKSGSIHEADKLGSGLSHYLEHMVFKGTSRHTGKALTELVQSAGGSINAYTIFDRTVYYIDGPSESLALFLEVLAELVFDASLNEADAISEKGVIQREIDMGLDDPDRRLSEATFSTAYREHPYRYPVIGHRSLFDALTVDDLRNYYKSRYIPNNMVVVVVGAVSQQTARERIEECFGRADRGCLDAIYLAKEPRQAAPRKVRLTGDYNLVRGGMVFKIPGLASAQAPALDMLASILGQGTSAILFQKLREELGIVHDVDATTWNPVDPGLFWISYVCEAGKEIATEAAVWEVLRSVQFSPLTKELLDKARRRASVGEVNLRSTMSGQASRLGLSEVVVGDLAYPHEYFKALARLTPEDLQAMAERYFQDTSLSQVTLGPMRPEVKNIGLITQKALPDFEEVVFPNGARLLLQPWTYFPKVHVRMVGHGGPMYETASERGLTNLMACLLTRDTAKRSAKDVAEAIEALGGVFSEAAGNNSFGVGVEVLPTDLPLGLELLHDALQTPAFLEATLKRERDGQVAALQEDEDDVVSFGVRRLRNLFFGEYPYADDTLGRIDTVKLLGLDAVRRQYKRLMSSHNAVFSASGAFERDELLDTLGPIIQSLPSSAFELAEQPFAGPAAVGEHRIVVDREQTVVFVAYPGADIISHDFHASEVLDELLSGLSSRLFMRVREERSLAYFVGANRMLGVNTGMFYLYAGTQSEAVPIVLQEMHAELERIKQGDVSIDEITRVRTHLKAQKRMALQTIGARASSAALNALYGLSINEWREYDRKIDAVTIDSLVDFVTKYLRPEARVQLVVESKD